MQNRQEAIHSKGFNIVSQRQTYEGPIDYNKIKVGTKTVNDAVLNLGAIASAEKRYGNKQVIYKALVEHDLPLLREISNYFYLANGIYTRVCDYYADLYRYDWYCVPEVLDESVKEEKVMKDFNNVLGYLDNSHIKKLCGDIALEVILNGAYYAYKVPCGDRLVLQQLPASYCRSRFSQGDNPVVEFNMSFFDKNFKDMNYRLKILKMFPDEFQKGYVLYKSGKLPKESIADRQGVWYTLEPGNAIKFSMNALDIPIFVNAIPALLDLDQAQDIDRRKQMQQLQKIIVQKLPLDKNGDLIFDVDEGQQLHNNAVQMLSRAIGVDVLTTFADTSVESLSDTSVAASQSDDLERVTNQIYTQAGVSLQQFNSDNSTALEKSIANDAATMYNMLLQFEDFLNELIEKDNNKRIEFRVQLLTTTIYNYQEMAKLYKEQMQLGFSKLLPQIALGQTQSAILANAFFENETLDLVNVFVPPLSSNVMNGDTISKLKNGGKITDSNEGAGRPTNESQGKVTSEKTAANKEAAANN